MPNELKSGKPRLTEDECELLRKVLGDAASDIAAVEQGVLALIRDSQASPYEALGSGATKAVAQALKVTRERLAAWEEWRQRFDPQSPQDTESSLRVVHGVLGELGAYYKRWELSAAKWVDDWAKLRKGGRPRKARPTAPAAPKRPPGRPRTSNSAAAERERLRRLALKAQATKPKEPG